MAQQRWVVDSYEKRNGRRPAGDFLDSLSDEEYALMDRKMGRLERWGQELDWPHAKYLRDKIWELRARRGKVRLRILYFRDRHKFILTNGYKKKSDRVADSEIDKAIEHRNDYFAQQGEVAE